MDADLRGIKQLPRYTRTAIRLPSGMMTVADGLSFYYSYREIFRDQVYEFPRDSEAPTILDCGANVGLATLYFKLNYPDSVVTAVEADPGLFEILSENVRTQSLSQVRLLNRAVWSSRTTLQFGSEGADAGRIDAAGATTLPKLSVDTVPLDELIDGSVDLLKMDIEGAEVETLCQSRKLSQVKRIFVEYHSFVDRPQRLDELLRQLTTCGFRYSIKPQLTANRPFMKQKNYLGMDMTLNVYAWREK